MADDPKFSEEPTLNYLRSRTEFEAVTTGQVCGEYLTIVAFVLLVPTLWAIGVRLIDLRMVRDLVGAWLFLPGLGSLVGIVLGFLGGLLWKDRGFVAAGLNLAAVVMLVIA